MASVLEFLSMGGYAFYVWSSYAITAGLLIGIVAWSARQFRITRELAFRRAQQKGQKQR